jgi:hypothetical protein
VTRFTSGGELSVHPTIPHLAQGEELEKEQSLRPQAALYGLSPNTDKSVEEATELGRRGGSLSSGLFFLVGDPGISFSYVN